MKVSFIFLILSHIHFTAYANSAYRYPYESSEAAAIRVLGAIPENSMSAYSTKKHFHYLNFQSVPQWSFEQLFNYFYYVRDLQFLEDPNKLVSARRLSWMYPDHGCWIRAQLMNYIFKQLGVPPLAKVFIYGNLKVDTFFSPRRSVSWWYHVIPMVRVDNEIFVVDPAIEITRPLLFTEWAGRQGDIQNHLTFAVCHPQTYGPRDDCFQPTKNSDKSAFSSISSYLSSETSRLKALGLDPKTYLDAHPPWPERH